MNDIDKILIIEDIPEVSVWLHAQINTLFPHRQIDHAESLAAANKAISQYTYELVLVDLGLPDGHGSTFISAYKAIAPSAFCVVTTIFDDADHLIRALRAGADGYLLKDDSESEFIEQLSGIIGGRPPLSASIARYLLQQYRPISEEPDIVLTQREIDVLTLAAKGLSVKHAADLLGISYYTAAGYLKEVYRKLQVNSRAEATVKAVNLGLINPK